jgi:enoyl-CoA hydratase
VFFGHGENFSRGIDVDAFAPLARTGQPFAIKDGMLDPFDRFPREAGWGNAMRYMLTGDHWGAEEALRMGVIQQIAPNPAQALEAGIGLARKIAACGPLGIKTTLESAHLSIDESEAAAFAKLNEQFGGLFHTEDFIEGRKAEAAGRAPIYQGK